MTLHCFVNLVPSPSNSLQDGHTALDVATQNQGADSELVQILTNAGAKTGKQVNL